MQRAIFAVVVIALITPVLGVPCLVAGLFDRSGRAAHAVIRLWSRALLAACGVRVDLVGAENVPAGPAVFAANHSSVVDIPIVFGVMPVGFRIIYKRSLRYVPFLGWCLWAADHIAIDRSNPFRARESLKRAAERIHTGTSVVVFPEGTRSLGASLLPFKRGSFVLAFDAGVPVVPLSIVDVKRIVPGGFSTLRAGRVALRIHPAVDTAGRDPETASALADEVRAIVAAGCEEVPA